MKLETSIKNILEETTTLKATPIFTKGPFPAIVYKHSQINGGLLKKSQLEVRLIGSDYDELLRYKEKILNVLDMVDETYSKYNDFSYHSVLAGGGDLYNEELEKWECLSLFVIEWR